MEITNQTFRKLVAFANGETDVVERAEVIDLLAEDPIYLEILNDIQEMMDQYGEAWETILEEDVLNMVMDYREKLQHQAFELVLNENEIDALRTKSDVELKQEMLEQLETTYYSVGKKIAKLRACLKPELDTSTAANNNEIETGVIIEAPKQLPQSPYPYFYLNHRTNQFLHCVCQFINVTNNIFCHDAFINNFRFEPIDTIDAIPLDDTTDDLEDRTAEYLTTDGFGYHPAHFQFRKGNKNNHLHPIQMANTPKRIPNRALRGNAFVTACCYPGERFSKEETQGTISRMNGRAISVVHV